MALFGDQGPGLGPVLSEGSPDRAVRAAVQMQLQLDELNRDHGAMELRLGIGIHTGALMLGTVGSDERIDTTVIGDTVNLSSRMEGLTRFYGTRILISESAHVLLRSYDRELTRAIDDVQVKGKQDVTTVFEVFAAESELTRLSRYATRDSFATMREAYRAGRFAEALKEIEQISAILAGFAGASDPVAELYRRRCHALIKDPPGPEWKPVAVMHGK